MYNEDRRYEKLMQMNLFVFPSVTQFEML